MPIPPHVLRKLQEVLGADAAAYVQQELGSMDSVRGDIAELRHQMELGFARVEAKMETMRADARTDLKDLKAELMKWMFLFWVGTAFTGILFRVFGWIT